MAGISKNTFQNLLFFILGLASLILIVFGMFILTIANLLMPFVGLLGWTFGFFLVSFGFGLLIYVVNLHYQSKAQDNNKIINQKLDQIIEKLGGSVGDTLRLTPAIELQSNQSEKCTFYRQLVVLLLFFGLVLVIISFWLSLSIVNISMGSQSFEKLSTCSNVIINNPNSINFSYFNYTFTNITTTSYQNSYYNTTNESTGFQNVQNTGIHNPQLFVICFILILLF